MRWLSVPPETTRAPRPASVSARIAAFSTVRRWSRRNSSPSAIRNATALPAITCMSGPPWTPGKTVLSTVARERALDRREGRRVDGRRELLAAEDQSAARPAERLVGRRRHEVGVRERRGMDAGRDEARDMGHVDEEQRPDAVGDRRHPLEVDDPRIRRGAGDDELGPDLASLDLERVVVDPLGVLADAVGVDLVEPAAEVQLHAVRQVAALVELHPEDPVARLEHAEVGGHVRLGARVGLDVDVLRAGKELQRPLLGERLGDVDVLAAAVVALAGQPLGVLVREPAALGLHDGGRGVVLAGDQLDLVVLAAALALHRRPELGVDVRDPGGGNARALQDGHRSHPPLAASGGWAVIGPYLPTFPDRDGGTWRRMGGLPSDDAVQLVS